MPIFQTGVTPAAAGTTITELSDWTTRSAGSDGDYLVYTPTGRLYVYSSDIGEWVDPRVQAGSPTLVVSIPGTEDGAALTDAGWSVTTSGVGAITSVGGYTKFSSNAGGTAYAIFNHATNGQRYFCGYGRIENPTGSQDGTYFAYSDADGAADERYSHAASGHDGTKWQQYNGNATYIGIAVRTVDPTANTWIELVVDETGVELYADHELVSSCLTTAGRGIGGLTRWLFGDGGGGGGGDTFVKEGRCVAWTP